MSSDSFDDGFDSATFKMSPRSPLPDVALDLSYSDENNVIHYSCHHRSSVNSHIDVPPASQSPWQGNHLGSETYSPYAPQDRSRSNSHSRSRSPTPNPRPQSPPLDLQIPSQSSTPPLSISIDSPSSPPPAQFEYNYRVPPLRLSVSTRSSRHSKEIFDPRLRKPINYSVQSSGAPLNLNSQALSAPPSVPTRTRSPSTVQPSSNPVSERRDGQGFLRSLLESGNTSNSSISQRSDPPEQHEDDANSVSERPISAAADSTQEVVDVEQTDSQPCVVDLTAEDDDNDDDVEIVSAEQSVVFLGTEPPRRRTSTRRKRRLPQSNSGLSEPPADTIVLNDSDPPPSHNHSNIPPAPTSRSPELFGDLLIPQPSSSLDDNTASDGRRACSCQLPINATSTRTFDLFKNCPIHRPMPRISERGPSHLDDPHRVPHHSRNIIMDDPIPQDVLADIVSIYAENGRNSRFSPSLGPGPNSLFCRGETSIGINMGLHHFPGSLNSQHAERKNVMLIDNEETPEWSCPICFESKKEAKKAEKSFSSTICGHVFCTPCLEASLKQAKLCPICRKKLSKKQYHTVFI